MYKYQKNIYYRLLLKSLFLLLISFNKISLADNIYIGVASNFFGPIEIIKEDFQNQTTHNVIVTSGSSGGLYSQITNGAP